MATDLRGFRDKQAWARAFFDAVGRTLPHLSREARLLVLAHAGFESGWGQGRAARKGNNVFNVTAGSGWTGETWTDVNGDKAYNKATCEAQGRPMTLQPNGLMACVVDQVWRIYPGVEGAIEDYWRLLGSRYPLARAALEAVDIPTFSLRLREKGYYQAPLVEYSDTLAAVYKTATRWMA